MFRPNDGISWTILTCLGSRRDRRWMSHASPIAPSGGNTIDRFPTRHCFEGDRRRLQNPRRSILKPSRSLRSPPALCYATLLRKLSDFLKKRPCGNRCLGACRAWQLGLTNRPQHRLARRAADAEYLRIGGSAHAKWFLPLHRTRRGPIRAPRALVKTVGQASAPRQEAVCGSSHHSRRTHTYRGDPALG